MLEILKILVFAIIVGAFEFVKSEDETVANPDIFGKGISDEDLALNGWKHQSSSYEDLKLLWQREQLFVQALDETVSKSSVTLPKDLIEEITDYVSDVRLGIQDQDYCKHPIHLFQLLKRTSMIAPKIISDLTNAGIVNTNDLIQLLSPPQAIDFERGATLGILNLQNHHGYKPIDLINGHVLDYQTGTIYRSTRNLTMQDALEIADLARKVTNFHRAVEWVKATIQAAKIEGHDQKMMAVLKNALKKMMAVHDDLIQSEGWLHAQVDFWGERTNVQLYKRTYRKSLMESSRVKFFKKQCDDLMANVAMNTDLYKVLPEKHVDEINHQLLRDESVKLCRGQQIRTPSMDKKMKCKFLDRDDPWLRLGPFKYETLNEVPHVGMFRDFASKPDMERMKDLAKGKMKSTPYTVDKNFSDFSKLRTSKIMYQASHHGRHVDRLNRNVELAMGMNSVGRQTFDAENFQVMNYGIGGVISPHFDSFGVNSEALKDVVEKSSEAMKVGGNRFVTFMIYLTSVESGGRTVFPQIGVQVKPIEGDALFWFNLDSGGAMDSRNLHQGCPVAYGNKWIANKWIKWLAQAENYKCHNIKFKPYPPF